MDEQQKRTVKIKPDYAHIETMRLLDENKRLRHELSEDGVTARRRMHDDIEILHAEVERLRAKLIIIHDISQNTVEPCWQALQNIAATAAGALADQGKGNDGG